MINPSRNALRFFWGLLGGSNNPTRIREEALAQSLMYTGKKLSLETAHVYREEPLARQSHMYTGRTLLTL